MAAVGAMTMYPITSPVENSDLWMVGKEGLVPNMKYKRAKVEHLNSCQAQLSD